MNEKIEQTDNVMGRLPFSAAEAIYLIEGLRNGLDISLMTPEYQVLIHVISLLKMEARLLYSGKMGKEQTDNEKLREALAKILCRKVSFMYQGVLIKEYLPDNLVGEWITEILSKLPTIMSKTKLE